MKIPDTFELEVSITAEDIQAGHPRNPWLCPLALAVRRAVHAKFPGLDWWIGVSPSLLRVASFPLNGDSWAVFPVPGAAQVFIQQYDGGNSVQPVTFTAAFAAGQY